MPFTIAWTACVALASMIFTTCGQSESHTPIDIKRDHAEISKLLDNVLLTASPVDSFQVLLQKVRSYPSVDSAWINGKNFFVQYKGGGIVSWTAPTIEPKTKGEQKQ